MSTIIESVSVDQMLASYQEHLDYGRTAGWWKSHTFTSPTDAGLIRFSPLTVTGEPGGPVEQGSRLLLEITEQTWMEHRSEDPTPTVESVAEIIRSLIERALPSRDTEKAALLTQLADLAAQRDDIASRIQSTARQAVVAGAQKTTVAATARISRTYLDKIIAGG